MKKAYLIVIAILVVLLILTLILCLYRKYLPFIHKKLIKEKLIELPVYKLPSDQDLFYKVVINSKPPAIDMKDKDSYKRQPVPKKIYRTWCQKEPKGICGGHQASEDPINITQKALPDWEQIIYRNEEIDHFLIREFGPEHHITKAYHLLNPKSGAARADLFRYLIIYKYGGLYLDMKSCAIKPLPPLPDDKDMWISSWPMQLPLFPETGEYINWYIYARAGAPILKSIIEHVVYNIYNLHNNIFSYPNFLNVVEYSTEAKRLVLVTTGPIAMTIAIKNSPIQNTAHYNNNINSSLAYACGKNLETYINDSNSAHYSLLNEPLVSPKQGREYIPKVIYIVNNNTDIIPDIHNTIKKHCSGYDIKIYDNNMCEEFLLEYYGKKTVELFKEIEITKYKNIFWSYCILYLFGGYYFDINIEFQKPISEIFNDKLPQTWYINIDENKKIISSNIISTSAANPILYQFLDYFYNNIFSQYYIESSNFYDIFTKFLPKQSIIPGNNIQKNNWNCVVFKQICKTETNSKKESCIIQNDKNITIAKIHPGLQLENVIIDIKKNLPPSYGKVTIKNINNITNYTDKIGVVMPIFGRPNYLENSLESIGKSNLNKVLFVLVDETSTQNHDNETINAVKQNLKEFIRDQKTPIISIIKFKHGNMFDSYKVAMDMLINTFKISKLMTCDSDVIVKENWIDKLVEIFDNIQHQPIIVTGFNTDQNHPILAVKNNYYIKKSMGGINMLFNTETYKSIVRTHLINLKWDWNICNSIKLNKGLLLCTKPSVVDHIGITGLWSSYKKVDRSLDFNQTSVHKNLNETQQSSNSKFNKILTINEADANNFCKEDEPGCSQMNQAGILKQIFNTIGVTNKYFVEFGARRPQILNSSYFRMKEGWHGLLLDGNPLGDGSPESLELLNNTDSNKTILRKEFITMDNVNEIFTKYNVPLGFDLLTIDIDKNDYWIIKTVDTAYFSPRVICIEFSSYFTSNEHCIPPYKENAVWDGNSITNSSLRALNDILTAKGYSYVTHAKGEHAIFIKNTELHPSQINKKIPKEIPEGWQYEARTKYPEKYNKNDFICDYLEDFSILPNKDDEPTQYIQVENPYYKGQDLIWINSEDKFMKNNWPNTFDFDYAIKDDIIKKSLKLPFNYAIIDCGAHIGDGSIPIAATLKKHNRNDIIVYAIDPDKYKCDFIKKLAKKNSLNNIIVINCGLSNTNSSYAIANRYDVNTGGNAWEPIQNIEHNKNEQTQFYTLDTLVNIGEIKEPLGYIHLDVESMEEKVVLGGIKTISKYKPELSLEFHDKDAKQMMDILSPIGYKQINKLEGNNIYSVKD